MFTITAAVVSTPARMTGQFAVNTGDDNEYGDTHVRPIDIEHQHAVSHNTSEMPDWVAAILVEGAQEMAEWIHTMPTSMHGWRMSYRSTDSATMVFEFDFDGEI